MGPRLILSNSLCFLKRISESLKENFSILFSDYERQFFWRAVWENIARGQCFRIKTGIIIHAPDQNLSENQKLTEKFLLELSIFKILGFVANFGSIF